MNQLHEIELEEVSELQQFESFKISDLDSLNWALRKVHAYDAQLKEIKTVANSERYRIDSWEQRESKGINDSIQFFYNLIQEYHAAVLAEDPNKKTLSTPYGKSKSTTSKAQPDKQNEEELLAFVEENELPFVKVKKELAWGDFKKTLQVVEKNGKQIVVNENGQAITGAKVKPQTTTFKVEI